MKETLFFHSHSSGNSRQVLSINGKPSFSGIRNPYDCKPVYAWQPVAQKEKDTAANGVGDLEHFLYTAQLEVFKKEMFESLRYAQSLQNALLQEKEELQELFPGSFILSRPKHVVSGDFYWFKDMGDKLLVSVGDCTGHGIPGALITMLALTTLHSAFNFHKLISPSMLLKFLDEDFNRKLSHKSKGKVMNDSMDIAICEIDKKEMTLTVSGAGSKVYLVRDGKTETFKTDQYSIGSVEPGKDFQTIRIPIKKGDAVFLSSDGYIDQFGGKNGKKLGSRAFTELIASLNNGTDKNCEKILHDKLTEWQGNHEQTDDILVMGLSI
jgi:serine phosphatase RsbU (regulator of sigma subunit)